MGVWEDSFPSLTPIPPTSHTVQTEQLFFRNGLSSPPRVAWKQPSISPPGQEGIKGWSMKTLKTHLNTPIFHTAGDQPLLPPPVQKGNLNRHAEQNLTALPVLGGGAARFATERTLPLRTGGVPRRGDDLAQLLHRTGIRPFTIHHYPFTIRIALVHQSGSRTRAISTGASCANAK